MDPPLPPSLYPPSALSTFIPSPHPSFSSSSSDSDPFPSPSPFHGGRALFGFWQSYICFAQRDSLPSSPYLLCYFVGLVSRHFGAIHPLFSPSFDTTRAHNDNPMVLFLFVFHLLVLLYPTNKQATHSFPGLVTYSLLICYAVLFCVTSPSFCLPHKRQTPRCYPVLLYPRFTLSH